MCKVSDKLKLCSCKTGNAQQLKHYWVLNRPEDKGVYTLGDIIPPADIGEQVEKYNIHSLRKQLNNGNCFDVNLAHQENDILELHFTCRQKPADDNPTPGHGNYLVYAFIYKKGNGKRHHMILSAIT